jgi:prepilin-type N-terminal cleavage/methylation domain-containing protein
MDARSSGASSVLNTEPLKTVHSLKARHSAAVRPAISNSKFQIPHFPPTAFSIIELLVVIAIIAILSGLAAVGFRSITRGTGARGASDLAASMALSARIEAMSFGYGSLLVVDNGTNADRKLQRMAVLRYTNAPDSADLGKNAELVGKPAAFPKGTFFLPDYSAGFLTDSLTNFPGGTSTPVLYFRFDGSGHLASSGTNRLVFSGNIMDTSGNLQNPEAMLAGRRGFLLRKNGRPAFFQTPEQMGKNP